MSPLPDMPYNFVPLEKENKFRGQGKWPLTSFQPVTTLQILLTQVAEIFRLLIQDFAFRIQFSVKYLGENEKSGLDVTDS